MGNESGRRILLSVGTSVFDPTLLAERSVAGTLTPRPLDYLVGLAEAAGVSRRTLLHGAPIANRELHAAISEYSARLAQRLRSGGRTAAELNTLRRLAPPPTERDELVLFASDNLQGALAARIVGEAARSHWGRGLTVRHRLIDGLDVGVPAALRVACLRLLRIACEEIDDAPGQALIIGTAGYKLMMAYLNLAGLLMGVPVVYLHERSECLHTLPVVSLTPDPRIWNRHFPIFTALASRSPARLPAEQYADLASRTGRGNEELPRELEPFVEYQSEGARLSPLGEVLHRRAMAMHADPLTGLPGRSFFDQALAPWLDRLNVSSLGVIVFDIDRFKAVNDTYGHVVGDRALQAVATAARRFQRRLEHRWVLRWGGEEFTAVCCGATLEQTTELAEQLRRAIAEQDIGNQTGTPFRVTITCGVAHWPTTIDHPDRPAADFHRLLRQADQALYKGKQRGRNRVVVFRSPNRVEREREGEP